MMDTINARHKQAARKLAAYIHNRNVEPVLRHGHVQLVVRVSRFKDAWTYPTTWEGIDVHVLHRPQTDVVFRR